MNCPRVWKVRGKRKGILGKDGVGGSEQGESKGTETAINVSEEPEGQRRQWRSLIQTTLNVYRTLATVLILSSGICH